MQHRAIQTKLNFDKHGRTVASTATVTYWDGRPADKIRVPYDGMGRDQAHTDAARRMIESVNWTGHYLPAPLTQDVWVWVPTEPGIATNGSKWVGVTTHA